MKMLQKINMILVMAKRELRSRYIGTLGGPAWSILQPLSTVLVYWFVFSVGFKAKGPGGDPFISYYLTGFAPWLLFSEVINNSTNCVVQNAHLVKKTVFPTVILPVVQILSASVTHAVLLAVTLVIVGLNGHWPSFMVLQLAYYYVALACLAVGISWALSALQVFNRDLAQFITVGMNLCFWLTPIVWTLEMIPEKYQWFFKMNPCYYFVNGYRNSILYDTGLWTTPGHAVFFWLLALPVFILGRLVFHKLRPDFPDAL